MEYPQVSFGTYRLGDNTYKSLNDALINGYRSIDTASLYKCEHLIGKFLKENEINRSEIWITSKLNPKMMDKSEGEILESINKTLTDLNTNYLDLFLIHCPNKTENINIKCWSIIENLYKNGTFRNIGVSNFNIDDLEEIKLFSTTPIYTNQIELSPFLKRPIVCEYMKKNNIIISAHSSLAKGEMFDNITLKNIASKYNKTPAQIMLKWGLNNNYHIMPRSSKYNHINDNLNLNFELNNDDMEELNNINITHITHPKYVLF
jgi:diketogulonate reductase-like aldo/keto reductase